MSSPSSRMESRGDKSRRSTLKTNTVVNKLQVLTEENEFHKIREKERSLHLVQSKKLLAQRNRNIERKRLSSAYAQTKPIVTSVGSVEPQQPNLTSSITLSTVIPASFKSNESDPAVVMSTAASVIQELIQENLPGEDNFDRFHYLHSTGSEISIARANNVTTSNGGFVNRKLTDEAKHVANFFTPSLVEICAGVIADNFVSQPTLGTIPDKLKNVVTKKLSVNLPLQISVPLVEDEDYWKKCCYMRWSDGQLGTFVKKQGENLFQHRKPPSIEEIMLNGSFEKKEIIQQNQKYQPVNQIDGKHKLWKQLYLERNLQEFLENIQSERSTSRELHVLAQQPDPKPEGNRGSELQILRSFDDLRRKNEVKMTPEEYEKTRQELASFDGEKLSESTISKENDIREEIEYTCLHSNKMRPNLNYYLLHNKTQKLPDESFREKLKDLYDGSESRGASRILNLTSNDDIFTFYDNAIHRNTVHKSQKKEALGSKSVQYWLLSKMDDEKNPKVAAMLNFVKVENLKTLQELCILCKPYIKELEILSLRSHINLTVLISNLSNLEYLHLTYGVRNAGLTFEMNMLGIYNEDCEDLASSLANSAYTANLKVLKLPDNLINDEKLKLLLTGLVKNNAITDLDLSHNKITALGCRSLSAYIRNNKTLKSLNLCDNNIRAEGGKFLATAIRTNDGQLETLNLRLNRLGDHGISAISASLEHNTKLRKLNLSSNDFGEEGLQHVAFYILDTDCSVNELDLSGNMFNENCGKILIKSLSNMTKKMILDVRSSQIRREEEIRIDSLIRNRTINQDKV